MIETGILAPEWSEEYEALNQALDSGLLYSGLGYRNFLARVFPNAQPLYLTARRYGSLVGALPAFLTEGPYGPVINSLPFYGSNGGVLFKDRESADEIRSALLKALDELARERGALTTLVISNPLVQDDIAFYDAHAEATITDDRIGQITILPAHDGSETGIETALMDSFHQKTRNTVRKGQKGGFELGRDNGSAAFRDLHALHEANLQAIGGLAKKWEVFESIQASFEAGRDYQVYQARMDGVTVGSLLVFFYNRTAEYFTPAVREDFRSHQPLSYLILEAMKDACRRGLKHWNWGGTWLSQDGVYQFKARWGTSDFPYRYYVREYPENGSLREKSRAELLGGYPGFFTLPFSALEVRV
jgi:hypothetical protein